jgi:hypothetical protein
MLEHDEKRDFTRMDVDCKITYKLIDSDEVKKGRCLSLSGSGVSFFADEPYGVGLAMEMNVLPINPSTPPMTAFIEVVRSIRKEDGSFEIAGMIKSLK